MSNLFSRLGSLLNRFVDVITQGNFERVRIIREFNLVFREAYMSSEIDRYCIVSTSPGNPEYRHALSTFYLRSGFKISIQNDENLKENDFVEISKYILESAAFVRQLMALGYDTLIIIGKSNYKGLQVSLKEISDFQKYMLGR
jgi:hypothetical protein